MKKTLVMAMLLVAGVALGATLPYDTYELRLSGRMDFSNEEGNTDFLVEGGWGYFIFDNVVVGGLLDVGYDGRHMGAAVGGYGEYNVDVNTYVMPYASLSAQLCSGAFYRQYASHNYLRFTPALGTKFFMSENLAIFTEVYLAFATSRAWNDDGRNEAYDTGLKVGLRFYY